MKKTLAILLSLALIICMMPATAFATAATDISTATVTLDKTTATYNGSAQTPVVTVKVGSTTLVKDTDYTVTWAAADSGATMFQDAGTYTATIEGKGAYTGTKTVNYTITPLDLSGAIVSDSEDILNTETPNGVIADSAKNKITVKHGDIDLKTFDGVTVAYEYIAATSTVPANISVTVSATNTEQSNIINTRRISITVKTDISEGYEVKIGGSQTFTYNGTAQRPSSVTVIDSATKKELPISAYTLSYENNINGGALANIIVTAKGNYGGSFIARSAYEIKQKDITSSGITVTAGTGTANVRPTVTVKDGTKTLVEGTDYNLDFIQGTNTVAVQGLGNYKGERSQTYTLVENTITSATVNTSVTYYYKGVAQHPVMTVTGSDGKNTLTRGTDYTLSYTYTDPVTNKVVNTDSPKDAAEYTVHVTGKGKYAGQVDATGTFEIEAVPLDYAKIVLGGSVLQSGVYVPKVTLKHIDGNFAFNETDYTVEYLYLNSSSALRKPKVIVTPIEGRNLTALGSKKKQLEQDLYLSSRSLSNCSVNFTDYRTSKSYDGVSGFQPSVTVKDTSLNRTLTKGIDYDVTYKNAAGELVYYLRDAGVYQVIITGTGAYSGTKTLTFTINGTDISRYTVTLKDASVQADGYGRVPVIESVKYGYTSSLSANDYTVSYEDPDGNKVTSLVAPGTYKVIVTGKNGYMGSAYTTFRIIGIPQTLTIEKTAYKVYEDSDSFKITARATGDGTGFKYTSNDPSVASVSATGVVTMHKVGRAVITVTTVGNKKSEPASDEVYVKVHPDKGYITRKPWNSGKKAQMQVRWQYQKGVTKYQIKYSTSKSFKDYDVKTVKAHGKDYTTQSTTIKQLKSGKQYYFKVRAVYETYNEKGTKITYFGKWSNWRSAKVK